MNNIVKLESIEACKYDVQAGLDYLVKYGKPAVSLQDDGWHSVCRMYVSDKGVTFDVRSDFNYATPADAINICIIRLMKTLKNFGK